MALVSISYLAYNFYNNNILQITDAGKLYIENKADAKLTLTYVDNIIPKTIDKSKPLQEIAKKFKKGDINLTHAFFSSKSISTPLPGPADYRLTAQFNMVSDVHVQLRTITVTNTEQPTLTLYIKSKEYHDNDDIWIQECQQLYLRLEAEMEDATFAGEQKHIIL